MSCDGKSLSQQEMNIKTKFIARMWKYLDDNFHKFSGPNQIKIALALSLKDIPQEVTGQIVYTSMQSIQIEHKPLKLDLGEDIPEDLQARRN